MKKILLLSAVALAVLSSGCDNDERLYSKDGEGRLVISPEIKSYVKEVSRAIASDDELYQSLKVWISNSKGLVRQYNGLAAIPKSEWLVGGNYIAEAWAGDSVSASFEKRWFKGSQPFTIRAGETTPVAIPCRIANVLVEIVYEGEVLGGLTGAKFTVSHNRGELVYEGAETRTGYFMMPSTDRNLAWVFEATGPTGNAIRKEGVIENAEPATKYILTVRAGSEDQPIGGTFFNIKVDTTVERVYKDFVIELPPIINGYDFDATSNSVFMQGDVGRRSILITSSSNLVNARLTLPGLSDYLGMSGGAYGKFDDIDFMTGEAAFLAEIDSHGINAIFDPIPGSDEQLLKINFEKEFTNSLPAGEYVFTYYAEDAKERTSSLTRTLRITDASLALKAVNDFDVWATQATVAADILQADYGNATFQYRQEGTEAWTDVAPSAGMKAVITGLTPNTTYQYRIISDKDNFMSDPMIFTTEEALQLPNSGFEEWNTSGKAYLLCTDANDMFWDSGNHGSATMKKNISQPDESIKHGGSYSIKMESQFVGLGAAGKFAAGNAFIGKYLGTEGTDGILGWGREFESRPKALRGYVKYNPAVVDKRTCAYIKSGDLDQGIIYLAILDNTTKDYDGSKWPVIIKTKTAELFDKNGANVIAYGEKIFTSATEGDGMIEFEIPLEYFKTDVKGAYIMVTMSASRYGDYFAGGENSIMWVDDLELVY